MEVPASENSASASQVDGPSTAPTEDMAASQDDSSSSISASSGPFSASPPIPSRYDSSQRLDKALAVGASCGASATPPITRSQTSAQPASAEKKKSLTPPIPVRYDSSQRLDKALLP